MNFNHTEERQMLADMAERFVRENLSIDDRHKAASRDDGFSRERFAEMAELGLVGALFSEEAGGFGGTGFDIAVVFEALGKGLVTEPFLPSLLAGTALAKAGRTDDVEAIASGEALYAFAHGEPSSRYTLEHVSTTAKKAGDGYTLGGNKAVVLGGTTADHLVVSARTSGSVDDADGISLFLVDAKSDGVHIRGYSTIDGYPAAEIALKDAAAELIGDEGLAIETIRAVNSTGALAVSAEALGAIEVCIYMTMDYLKTRTQFGRPIGTFQALQHRMVDMMGEREQIRSAVINAAGHLLGDQRDWHVSAAKNLIGRSGRMIAEESIQMHGGIAMTWEYAVAHYAKRVIMIDHLFGDVDHHLEQIIKLGRAA
ncbi:acyl-CoA dehydrogenase family protein [Ahrensia sp. R2A130]|uniref:acyl-CoA dehydrogenase family protein n=1 Tax=Ahrensia sp. R2A130 TaxID=744979 RepID=UPI0001E0F894|nr:acyl-CoA dehydrogenase family protein [Ahrensia sp. R2A130]EFL89025.1 acyl-CoA dehydrogenase domain-containing protein [Ahrensia sp. R2A130]